MHVVSHVWDGFSETNAFVFTASGNKSGYHISGKQLERTIYRVLNCLYLVIQNTTSRNMTLEITRNVSKD